MPPQQQLVAMHTFSIGTNHEEKCKHFVDTFLLTHVEQLENYKFIPYEYYFMRHLLFKILNMADCCGSSNK
jgi:hypothetical protein